MLRNVCEECEVIQLIPIVQEGNILMFSPHKELYLSSQIPEPLQSGLGFYA